MTYPLLATVLIVLSLCVAAATYRRPRFGARMAASGITAAALVVLTAIFDNLMIGVGLFHYPQEHLSGLRIGLAPIEDFSYPIAVAFLVPAVWTIMGRPEADAGRSPARTPHEG